MLRRTTVLNVAAIVCLLLAGPSHTALAQVAATKPASPPASAKPADKPPADPANKPPDAAAVKPGEKPAEKPADPAAAPVPPKVRIVPGGVILNCNIGFDEQGKQQHQSQNLSLSLTLITEGGSMVTVGRNLTIDKLVTDRGEDLRPDANNIPREFQMGRDVFMNRGMNDGMPQNRIGFGLSLPLPARAATKIVELSGSIELEFSSGAIKQVVFEPFKDFEGKRVRIADLPDSNILITRPEPAQLRVELANKLWSRLSKARFLDEQGRELNVNGWGGGGGDGRSINRTFRLTMPDNGKVVIDFFPQVNTVRVPFTVKNIPLPAVNGAEPVDMVVEAREPKDIIPQPGAVERAKLAPAGAVDMGG